MQRRPVDRMTDPLVAQLFAEADRKNVSDGELARRTGFDRSNVSKWRNGLHDPSLLSVRAIADALNVSLTIERKEPQ